MKLGGKKAIVTGGGTGIGKAIALEFAGAGADIAICSRNIQNIEKVRDEIIALGRDSMAVSMDVRVKEDVDNMVQQVIDEFGRIDILVNNAGTNRPTPVLDLTEDTWNLILDTNLKGLFFCTQAVARHMVKQKSGKIINISSTASMGANEPGQAAYAASKTGVNAFTKACAREFGPYGINVNAIAPGRILTPLVYASRTPEQVEKFLETGKSAAVLGRLGTVEEIAHLALFLASDDSAFITAEIIACNGGRTNLMG
ncbi:MAG: 3-oxoacyl-ACP reductase FabG [Dehalococcoidia bacterium]|nr:MAG: 3-oxoacyl-ACP reductase FabG [Dehalococcoidia bacterium]